MINCWAVPCTQSEQMILEGGFCRSSSLLVGFENSSSGIDSQIPAKLSRVAVMLGFVRSEPIAFLVEINPTVEKKSILILLAVHQH